jgi:hypothetical protein
MRIVVAFQVKRLPDEVDEAWTSPDHNGAAPGAERDAGRAAAAVS